MTDDDAAASAPGAADGAGREHPGGGVVARVAVDVPLPHLDRAFDYAVPAELDALAVPGCRVRVRFAGALVDGWLLERVPTSGHEGRLTPLAKVVSAEPVLAPEVLRLARAVADRWAGNLVDVLRLAVPPRHARVEGQPQPGALPGPLPLPPAGEWARYGGGEAYLRALGQGRPARAVWGALPGPGWPAAVATAVATTLAAGRGAVVVVPDARDLARVDAALTALLGAGRHVALSAGLGPSERYRRWLAVRRGEVRAVVGTRAAAWAPVADLGLVVVWDDGDDVLAEQRSPYPHARDVLVLRAHTAGAAALLGGHARTAEAQQLLVAGWAQPLVASRAVVRAAAPRVRATGDDTEAARDPAARSARLPSLAWRTAGEALAAGAPVLVQVPRRGYVPVLACDRCRTPARCPACAGPLGSPHGGAGSLPTCRWCAVPAADWTCPVCRGHRLRAAVVGAGRTAEELGRAFPGVRVRTSGGSEVLDEVGPEPALVVATPGAEPVADGGYGAVLLLDGWALLGRADLRAGEEAVRRWLAAAALARPADEGGRVVVVADGALTAVQALVRLDPAWFAERELSERAALGFPPAVRMAALTGPAEAVGDLLARADLPAGAVVLGPVPTPTEGMQRMLVRVPRGDGAALAAALKAASGVRSARRAADPVQVRLDPSSPV